MDRVEGNTDAFRTMVLSGQKPLTAINATIVPEVHQLYRDTIRFMYKISNHDGFSWERDIEKLKSRYECLRERDKRICLEVTSV